MAKKSKYRTMASKAAEYRAMAMTDSRVDDECEVDPDAKVVISGDGSGAFVQAWLWIPSKETE